MTVTEAIKGQGYILLGTGDFGERCYRILAGSHALIAEVWDNDSNKKLFHGIPVCRPHKYMSRGKIVLASARYEDEMKAQIREMWHGEKVTILSFKQLVRRIYFSALSQKYPHIFGA